MFEYNNQAGTTYDGTHVDLVTTSGTQSFTSIENIYQGEKTGLDIKVKTGHYEARHNAMINIIGDQFIEISSNGIFIGPVSERVFPTITGCTFNDTGTRCIRFEEVSGIVPCHAQITGCTFTDVGGGTAISTYKVTGIRVDSCTFYDMGTIIEEAGPGGEVHSINGFGEESANAETPTSASWNYGDIVAFTDSGDGSGNGTYVLKPDVTWLKISDTN
jgi:hypothetical protein